MRRRNASLLTGLCCLILTSAAINAAPPSATPAPAPAPTATAVMSNDRIDELLSRLELETVGGDGQWHVVVDGRALLILTDPAHDRMRIMGHVTAADALDEAQLTRVLTANFDSALDARYALARNTLWSVFLHPLSTLTDRDFLLGIGQVVNLANTFGSDYSSGLLLFRGGDSGAIRERELLDELVRKGLVI